MDATNFAKPLPLLPQLDSTQQLRRNCLPRLKYRLPLISEKGAIFMIVWNFFFILCFFLTASRLLEWQDIYAIYSVITAALLIIFVITSRWYKLRKRDDIVPYHMLAENYFETNYERERAFKHACMLWRNPNFWSALWSLMLNNSIQKVTRGWEVKILCTVIKFL